MITQRDGGTKDQNVNRNLLLATLLSRLSNSFQYSSSFYAGMFVLVVDIIDTLLDFQLIFRLLLSPTTITTASNQEAYYYAIFLSVGTITSFSSTLIQTFRHWRQEEKEQDSFQRQSPQEGDRFVAYQPANNATTNTPLSPSSTTNLKFPFLASHSYNYNRWERILAREVCAFCTEDAAYLIVAGSLPGVYQPTQLFSVISMVCSLGAGLSILLGATFWVYYNNVRASNNNIKSLEVHHQASFQETNNTWQIDTLNEDEHHQINGSDDSDNDSKNNDPVSLSMQHNIMGNSMEPMETNNEITPPTASAGTSAIMVYATLSPVIVPTVLACVMVASRDGEWLWDPSLRYYAFYVYGLGYGLAFFLNAI